MNPVGLLLKSKGNQVYTTSGNTLVLDGLKLMAEKRIGSLVVVDGDRVMGIFTERDYARKIGPQGKKPEATFIKDVMTTELITVTPDQSVKECMVLMTNNYIRHLPVMDNGRLIGLISIGDVVKDIIEELEFQLDQLTKYISGLR